MTSVSDMRAEMDRLWETVLGKPWFPFRPTGGQHFPALDVFEKDDHLHIKAELPGMTDKDVEISVTNDLLTISGEKKEEKETKEDNYYRSERTDGKFTRQVALPAGADTDQAKAKFQDGVLEIDIPIAVIEPPETKKQIEIKPAA